MIPFSSDASKARVRRIAVRTVALSRRAAPPTLEWIKTHKAIVTILLLVIYIAFEPAKVTTVEVIKEVPKETLDGGQASNVGKNQRASPETAAGVPLYNSNSAGKDPSWGLPTALDTEQNKAFAIRLKTLEQRFSVFVRKQQLLNQEYDGFANSPIESLLFERIAGNGFRDRDLPIEWRKIARYNGLNGLGAQIEDETTQVATQGLFSGRIFAAKADVVLGEPTIGDTLFASAFEKYLDGALEGVEQELTAVAAFSVRVTNEFPELALTYYDADETAHVHDAATVTADPLNKEDVAAMQKVYEKCKVDVDQLDVAITQCIARRELIQQVRDAVMGLHDAKMNADWSAVAQARQLSHISGWSGKFQFDALPDKLVEGQVNSEDKISLQTFASKVESERKEADRQKILQLAFKAEIGKYPAIESIGGDPAIWNATASAPVQK